jgi:hypothetical protein
MYPTLVEKIGEQRFAAVKLFFSPFLEKNPYISLYMDHKLADIGSTFTIALSFGPIVPANYNYWELFDDDDGTFVYTSSINAKDFSHDMYLKEKDELMLLLSANGGNNGTIQFHPFINQCKKLNTIENIVNNGEIQNMDYSAFMSPFDDEKYLKQFMKEHPSVYTPILEKPANIGALNIIKLFYKTQRCPTSIYKENFFL